MTEISTSEVPNDLSNAKHANHGRGETSFGKWWLRLFHSMTNAQVQVLGLDALSSACHHAFSPTRSVQFKKEFGPYGSILHAISSSIEHCTFFTHHPLLVGIEGLPRVLFQVGTNLKKGNSTKTEYPGCPRLQNIYWCKVSWTRQNAELLQATKFQRAWCIRDWDLTVSFEDPEPEVFVSFAHAPSSSWDSLIFLSPLSSSVGLVENRLLMFKT